MAEFVDQDDRSTDLNLSASFAQARIAAGESGNAGMSDDIQVVVTPVESRGDPGVTGVVDEPVESAGTVVGQAFPGELDRTGYRGSQPESTVGHATERGIHLGQGCLGFFPGNRC